MIRKLAVVAFAVGLCFGLMTPAAHAQRNCDWSGGTVIGTLGGAALGGFVGSQFGRGDSRLAFTGLGVLVGGLAGNQIGKALTCRDQQQVHQTTQRTLETQPSGTPIAWNNPDSGNSGTVMPTKTYQQANGTPCREFQQTVTVQGKTQTGYGKACRQADGSWKIVQ